MLIKTTRFGEIEVPEEKIIYFSSGMIGFENYKKYVLFEHPRKREAEEPALTQESKQAKENSISNQLAAEKQNKVEASEQSCFVWLQSLELANLAFLLIDPFSFYPEYEFNLSEKDVIELEIENASDILVLTTVSLPKGAPQNMTSNLLAPIIINSKKQIGKQVILNENNYSIAENILARLQKLNLKEEETALSATP